MVRMQPVVFFRDDDVGGLDASIIRTTELFQKYKAPLCYEVIPTKVQKEFVEYFNGLPLKNIFDIGQHGYAHLPYREGAENKGEFGPNRSREDKRKDIVAGWNLIVKHFGPSYLKVFIPPWSLMDQETYGILRELGYEAFSCIKWGEDPNFFKKLYAKVTGDRLRLKKNGMVDLSVSIDAMKDFGKRIPRTTDELIRDFKRVSTQTKYVGFMLHDKIMNDDAFAAIEGFLAYLVEEKIPMMNMRQIIEVRK